MAVGLLGEQLEERSLDSQYQVDSAGVYALDDHPASRNAIFVMAERGIDITDHRGRTITGSDMVRANLVLAMSREHTQALRQSWPQYGWKVYLLSETVDERKDVKDPYGGSIDQYRAAADVISGYIEEGLDRILELA
jgi:protein-tyrosine-phosphatase